MAESHALAGLEAGCPEEICGNGAAASSNLGTEAVAIGDFVRVAHRDEIAPGTGKTVDVGGTPVALFNVGGTYHAILDICPHRGGPLGQGELSGSVVRCPWHGHRYDVVSGRGLSDGDGVPTFEVRVEREEILVR